MSDPNPQNPVINQDGTANVSPGSYATWETPTGTNATLNITNSDNANNCMIAISGAPASGIIVQVNGQTQTTPLDNLYTIPPNQPSYAITAFGNFTGSTVTINNITNAAKPATAKITAQKAG